MKTAKYFIRFENIEVSMSTEISISKAEYNKQLKYLREQVKSTKDQEYAIEERETRQYDRQAIIETVRSFQCGCAYTDLIEMKCKEGYKFK